MRCPNCRTLVGAPNWKARTTILHANKYGRTVRIFCEGCGQWTDVKVHADGKQVIQRIVKTANGEPMIEVER
jgi:RNase P subunit RPR2